MSEKESPFKNCLLFTSNVLARNLAKMADESFGEFGMSYSHAFIILYILKKPGAPIGDITAALMLSPSTVTRLVEKLEGNGYLKRENSGRSNKINPTAKAEKIGAKLQTAWDNLQKNYREKIGEEQAEKLTNRTLKAAKKLDKKAE